MTGRRDHLDTRAVAILLACCLFWGVQQVLVKATLPELPPVFQAGLRFGGATLLLWGWCALRGIRLLARDGSGGLGLLAGGLFAAEFAAMYLGLQHTTASRLTVFVYTSPFWVALLLPLLVPAERLGRAQWLGLVCAFAAVVLALREGFAPRDGGVTWAGDLLGLAGGALWGLTTVTIRATRLARVGPEKLLFYQVAVSAVALPLLSLALGERWVWRWSAFAAGSLALQTVVGAFASYLVWMWLLPGHAPVGLRVSHPHLRAAGRRAVAGRAGDGHAAAVTGAGGRRHGAGEPAPGAGPAGRPTPDHALKRLLPLPPMRV